LECSIVQHVFCAIITPKCLVEANVTENDWEWGPPAPSSGIIFA
jgi:hypothetical protein